MKKSIGVYSVIWAICLAVFNVIVFVTPNEIGGVSKFTASFWVGYVFITVAFIGQLVCAFFALKAENIKKMFYRIPMISISYTGLILMLIAGGIFMAIPTLPEWIGIIVCAIILAFNAIAVIKATAAAEVVGGIDEKLDIQIKRQFNAFSDAVKAEDDELAKETADALAEIIERRNQECKLLK